MGGRQEYVRPLQEKVEPAYVVPGSDAEEHLAQVRLRGKRRLLAKFGRCFPS